MAADLPVGTYVRVDEPPIGSREFRSYVGRIVGYDMGRTKYEVGCRYGGWAEWRFMEGGAWAFPSWVTEISEAEALRVGDGREEAS